MFFLVHNYRAELVARVETRSATRAAVALVNHPLIAQFIEGSFKIGFQHGGLAYFDASLTCFAEMRDDFNPRCSGY